MIFNLTCQYAIKSCIYLARKKTKVDAVEISEFINSPLSFTSKTLQKLAKSNIISSAKGRTGGFYLSETQYETLTVKDIFSALELQEDINECVLGLPTCGEENPCPVHHLAISLKHQLKHILSLKIKDLKDVGKIKFDQPL